MKPGTSKNKGNNFENKIAKILSLWLSNGKQADLLERAPTSGAKATIHKKAGRNFTNIAGDIISVHEDGMKLVRRFVIELKHQSEESLNVVNLVFQTADSGITAYWQKLLGECATSNKFPMLIFRQNSRPIYLALCQDGVKLLDCGKLIRVIVKQPGKNLYILPLELFLKKITPVKLEGA